jgi:hypothetical protein
MTEKIAASAAVALVAGYMLSPPDPLRAIVFGGAAAILCAIPLLVLARFEFLKAASRPIHTLICVLVCLIAILSLACFVLASRIAHLTA